MRKHLFFFVMLSLCIFGSMVVYPTPAMATVAQSPTIKVRGQVVDEQGEPLTGATIKIKGGQGGTITDLDGNFQLEVLGNATLLISYVGYKEREVAVRNRAIIDPIQLQSDEQMLEQVVVVGYGTQKKSDLTGSVAVVDAEALKQTSNSNISTMLEGKVSGVQITSDGQPVLSGTVERLDVAPQTTAAATTVPKAETTAAPETVTEPPATTASSMETVPIRQNIYLYYKLTWEGNPYDTDYMEVSSSSLDQYLGYGVTRGNDVEDTYTVLIYSIVGVDPVQQVAVQYAGEEKYYVFTIQ